MLQNQRKGSPMTANKRVYMIFLINLNTLIFFDRPMVQIQYFYNIAKDIRQ